MRKKLLVLVGVLGFVAAGACGQSNDVTFRNAGSGDEASPNVDGGAAAASTCANRGEYKVGTTLRAAYSSTVGDLLAWSNSLNPSNFGKIVPDFFVGRPDLEPMVVCFVDGDFAIPVPPGGTPPNRAAIVIDTLGRVTLQLAGYHDRPGLPELALTRPNG